MDSLAVSEVGERQSGDLTGCRRKLLLLSGHSSAFDPQRLVLAFCFVDGCRRLSYGQIRQVPSSSQQAPSYWLSHRSCITSGQAGRRGLMSVLPVAAAPANCSASSEKTSSPEKLLGAPSSPTGLRRRILPVRHTRLLTSPRPGRIRRYLPPCYRLRLSSWRLQLLGPCRGRCLFVPNGLAGGVGHAAPRTRWDCLLCAAISSAARRRGAFGRSGGRTL